MPVLRKTRVLRTGTALLLALSLVACGVAPRAVVVDRSGTERSAPRGGSAQAHGRVHVVQRGDTLYSIAFRHGLEYRQVASWNGIAPPYTIYPGQRIRLYSGQPAGSTASRPAPAPQRPPAPATPPARPATPPGGVVAGTTPAPSSGSGTPAAPASNSGTSTRPPASAPATPASGSTPTAPTPAPTPAPASTGAPRWQWPTSGQVISRFVAGDPTRQGISIAGTPGQAVNAAADGVIVYSGSGLIGYGELIIVKHNDEFLSAYGHNRKRLVNEGEQVRAGQQIAEMGRSGAARDMLHFEIRRNGRPVDPAGFLPKR